MLWPQGSSVHLAITQVMQLVGSQYQHTLALHLRAIAAISVVVVVLFQLVVRASHLCQNSLRFMSMSLECFRSPADRNQTRPPQKG